MKYKSTQVAITDPIICHHIQSSELILVEKEITPLAFHIVNYTNFQQGDNCFRINFHLYYYYLDCATFSMIIF